MSIDSRTSTQDEVSSLLPPELGVLKGRFDIRGGLVGVGRQIRRGRRLAIVLSERVLTGSKEVLTKIAPPEHRPMGEFGSFIFLSNLIMGTSCRMTVSSHAATFAPVS